MWAHVTSVGGYCSGVLWPRVSARAQSAAPLRTAAATAGFSGNIPYGTDMRPRIASAADPRLVPRRHGPRGRGATSGLATGTHGDASAPAGRQTGRSYRSETDNDAPRARSKTVRIQTGAPASSRALGPQFHGRSGGAGSWDSGHGRSRPFSNHRRNRYFPPAGQMFSSLICNRTLPCPVVIQNTPGSTSKKTV